MITFIKNLLIKTDGPLRFTVYSQKNLLPSTSKARQHWW